jgi:putative tryptophan/tyrosine transport system substrate-binding protein
VTRRRLLLAFVTVATYVWQLGLAGGAHAQQPTSPRRIGVLQGAEWFEAQKQAFRQGLLDAGYSEGRDVVIEWRSPRGDYARIPALVADLVQRKVDVMVVTSTPEAQAAKRATSTIPIVMAGITDPVGSGLVASLAHPGGNITGPSMMYADISSKRLQLLKEAIPRLTRVAVMWNPDTPPHTKVVGELKAAAPSLSIELSFVSVRAPEEIDPAFAAITRARAQALYVPDDAFFWAHRATLLKLGSKARLPVIYWQREVAHEGGLMSYGPDVRDMSRLSAQYVGRILKGAKPGDLPIEQPTQFELVVNLKTAKSLGITIPESILLRADEVIR